MAVTEHYCCGKLASVDFFNSGQRPCKCGKKAKKPGCCSDKTTQLKTCDNLSKAEILTSPDPMGIKVGSVGKIYFVDKANKRAYMINNAAALPLSVKSISANDNRISASPNPTSSKVTLRDAESQPVELVVLNIICETVLRQNTTNSDMIEIELKRLRLWAVYCKSYF